MPTRSWDEILDRHSGPYLLCAGFPDAKKGMTTAWLKRIPRGKATWTNDDKNDAGDEYDHVKVEREDVLAECRRFCNDAARPASDIGVFSVREQQYVFTFSNKADGQCSTGFGAPSAAAAQSAEAPASTTTPGVARSRSARPATTSAAPAAASTATTSAPSAPRTTTAARPATAPASSGAGRGGKYRFLKDAPEKLGTTPALVLATFKRMGSATVAEVAAAIESSLTTSDPKALVASHATRLKAAGLLEKEAA